MMAISACATMSFLGRDLTFLICPSLSNRSSTQVARRDSSPVSVAVFHALKTTAPRAVRPRLTICPLR